MADVPIERQIACVRREVGMRRRVYPGWVAARRLTQEEADRQLEAMEAALATLERVKAERDAALEPPTLF